MIKGKCVQIKNFATKETRKTIEELLVDYYREQNAQKIDNQIRLTIKPCPRWFPAKLWLCIALRFLQLEHHASAESGKR